MTSRPSLAASASSASIGASLTHAAGVQREGAIDRVVGGGLAGVAACRQRRLAEAARRSPPTPRRRRASRPPGAARSREISAARSATASTSSVRRDPDEPVRVEVVAEQERRVPVGRREQPRAAVVEQVALVDRLQPDRVPRSSRERREDRLVLALGRRPQRLGPERALGRRLVGDHVPDVNRRSRQPPPPSSRLGLAVRGRDEHRLELRRRDVDPSLEQMPEQRAVALRVARLRVVEPRAPARRP